MNPTPAENFQRARGDGLGDLRCEVLGHGGLSGERESGVTQARGVVNEQARGFHVGRHAREVHLDSLEVGDRLAELFPLLGIGGRLLQRAAGQPDHLRADADAALVQRLDGNFVALADLPHHIRFRDPAVIQDQLARGGCAYPELVLLLANGEAGEIPFDDEAGDAAIPGFRFCVCEHEEDAGFVAVCDPELAAVQDVVAALLGGASGQREGIRAGAGFR